MNLDRQATLALLCATAVWGATFVSVKDALAHSDAFTFLMFRFAVGALSAAVFAGPSALRWVTWHTVARPGVWLGVLLYGGYALQTLGLQSIGPARSAFITGTCVLLVPFASWAASRRRPASKAFVASVLALVGLHVLTGLSPGGAVPMGDVLTLGCAGMYALHITAMSRVPDGLPLMPLTAVQLAVVSVLSSLSLPLVSVRLESTPSYWDAVLFTGVVASAMALAVQGWAQRRIPAVRAAVIYALEPLFAIAWAAVCGLGWPSKEELVGGALILTALWVSESPARETLESR